MTDIPETRAQLNAVVDTLQESNEACDGVRRVHDGMAYLGERALVELDKVNDDLLTDVVGDVRTGYAISGGIEETFTEGIDAVKGILSNLGAAMDHFSSARTYGDKVKRTLSNAEETMDGWRLSAYDANQRSATSAQITERAKRLLQGYGHSGDLSESATAQHVQALDNKSQMYRDEVLSKVVLSIRGDKRSLGEVTTDLFEGLHGVGKDEGGVDSIKKRVLEAQKILEGCFDDLRAMNSSTQTAQRIERLSTCPERIAAVKENTKDTVTFLRGNEEVPNELTALSHTAKEEAEQALTNL